MLILRANQAHKDYQILENLDKAPPLIVANCINQMVLVDAGSSDMMKQMDVVKLVVYFEVA